MVYIYVLQLNNNKYYVGKTKNPQFRLENHYDIPYDIGAFNIKDLKQQKFGPVAEKWPIVFLTNPGQTPPVNKAAFLKMREVFKSVVVVAMFSGVASDYVLKEDYWHVLLTKLKYDHNLNFYYDQKFFSGGTCNYIFIFYIN